MVCGDKRLVHSTKLNLQVCSTLAGLRGYRYFGGMSYQSGLQASPVVSLYSVLLNKETAMRADTTLP